MRQWYVFGGRAIFRGCGTISGLVGGLLAAEIASATAAAAAVDVGGLLSVLLPSDPPGNKSWCRDRCELAAGEDDEVPGGLYNGLLCIPGPGPC